MARKSTLGLFDLALEFTHSTKVSGYVCTGLLLVLFNEVINDTVIKVFTTKVGVTGSCKNFKDTFINRKEGNIESSSSEIIDDDTRFTALLVETVGDSGGGRFVDDTEDVETSDGAGILGSLTLGVVEVCRNGDDGMAKAATSAKISFGRAGFAHLIFLLRNCSAVSLILTRTIDDSSSGD